MAQINPFSEDRVSDSGFPFWNSLFPSLFMSAFRPDFGIVRAFRCYRLKTPHSKDHRITNSLRDESIVVVSETEVLLVVRNEQRFALHITSGSHNNGNVLSHDYDGRVCTVHIDRTLQGQRDRTQLKLTSPLYDSKGGAEKNRWSPPPCRNTYQNRHPPPRRSRSPQRDHEGSMPPFCE